MPDLTVPPLRFTGTVGSFQKRPFLLRFCMPEPIQTKEELRSRIAEIDLQRFDSPVDKFAAQMLAASELYNNTKGAAPEPKARILRDRHRVALYARVSTKDKGQDTENQLAQLREFCARQDWPIIEEYIDQATGKRSDRSRFQALFADAACRRFDLVLFWSLDRFSREGVLETLQHLQKLTAAKVDWKSFTEQYLDSCGIFRDAVLAILATIAKQEQVRLSERTSAGLARARAKGIALGRPKLIFNRQKVVDLRAAGLSFRAIAKQLKLSMGTVHRVIHSR
jgi:DNA invertase Pin-like site-specific DNA recombinase